MDFQLVILKNIQEKNFKNIHDIQKLTLHKF